VAVRHTRRYRSVCRLPLALLQCLLPLRRFLKVAFMHDPLLNFRCFYICEASTPATTAEVRADASFTVADPVPRSPVSKIGRAHV